MSEENKENLNENVQETEQNETVEETVEETADVENEETANETSEDAENVVSDPEEKVQETASDTTDTAADSIEGAEAIDGEPVSGIVAVSSVGTQQNKESKRLFLRGYEEMMKRLAPEWVIFYGKVPEECDWNVIRVKPHYDDIVKRRKANEISVSAGVP